jgi:hypothetical protein
VKVKETEVLYDQFEALMEYSKEVNEKQRTADDIITASKSQHQELEQVFEQLKRDF